MNGNDQASDYDVLHAVSDSLSHIPVARPPQLETIMARGRARQRRQRGYGMTAALAAAAAAAVTVTVLPAGSQPARPVASSAPSSAPSARLAAWTVTRKADGDISVTISELSDPAGLQSALRADGVAASVTFLSQPNPACSPLGFGPGLLGKIFPGPPRGSCITWPEEQSWAPAEKPAETWSSTPRPFPAARACSWPFPEWAGLPRAISPSWGAWPSCRQPAVHRPLARRRPHEAV